MIKIFNKKQLGELINYPIELIKNISEVIEILNENYISASTYDVCK